MNFFEHQERARRRTWLLGALFVIAALATAALANGVMLVSVAFFLEGAHAPSLSQWATRHPGAVIWTTLGTLGFIGAASLYRMASLSRGGGAVAQALGGVLVDGETGDPLKRQLLNVVEEMAIASGVPVPAVYVLEQESGINAFAAGFTPSDAAIAVTRGTLEVLTRDELQGVIAHEFSHILNGDMRLNTRLMGVLFGIVVVGLTGRLILRGLSRVRTRSRNGGQIIAVAFFAGLALTIIGYVGMLFGSLIRAAVSRQREFLADASAVQFTRNPLGIAGALKKIAVSPLRSVLQSADAEEVGHMLIADGRKMFASLFATHPPLLTRIKAIDRRFDPAELDRIQLKRPSPAPAVAAPATLSSLPPIVPALVIAAIGNPSEGQLAYAADIEKAIPDNLQRAARSRALAPALVIALALNLDAGERGRQLARLRERLPASWLTHVEALAVMAGSLAPEHRLPLIEIAMPALRARAPDEVDAMVKAMEEALRLDGRFDVMDYALIRVLRLQLQEAASPQMAGIGRTKLHNVRDDSAVLLSFLAQAGNSDKTLAHAAYERGMRHLFPTNAPRYAPPAAPWVAAVDRALTRLDQLAPAAKQSLVEALMLAMFHDRRVTLGESELFRAICASLHCPVPPLTAANKQIVANETAPAIA
jgi:Zn-dependent protease with chaperone function